MISVTILTKNNAKSLARALDSTRSFQEVLVLDSGSTDSTQEIALSYPNVKWCAHSFLGFGPMRRLAEELATYEWILALDSDEVLSEGIIQRLSALSLCEGSIYAFARKNFLNDKWIKRCGWYPDWQLRLYHKGRTRFSSALVHEKVVQKPGMRIVYLKEPILHYSYREVDDFLCKMRLYTNLFVEEHLGKRRSSLAIALLHGSYAFFKSFFLQLGCLGGKEGLIISLYNSHVTFYKYLKLAEKGNKSPLGKNS